MIIIGAKGFAKEVLEIFWQNNQKEEIIFFDNVNTDIGDLLYGQFRILKSIAEVENHFSLNADKRFTIGIGNPINRIKLYKIFLNMGGTFSSTISPYCRIGHFENVIEDGCNIMTGTVITNSIKIGKGALINLNCTIGHDCTIGEFVEMSPGTHISGNCKIGNFCIFGTNSTILPKMTLGDNVIVGAGAVVTKDVPSNSLVVGIPAKVIKELPKIDY
jgi:sugar O-acyltransferase (sialic acid O-acetyltransferase NeuD family)